MQILAKHCGGESPLVMIKHKLQLILVFFRETMFFYKWKPNCVSYFSFRTILTFVFTFRVCLPFGSLCSEFLFSIWTEMYSGNSQLQTREGDLYILIGLYLATNSFPLWRDILKQKRKRDNINTFIHTSWLLKISTHLMHQLIFALIF